jgi:hypothetical protein
VFYSAIFDMNYLLILKTSNNKVDNNSTVIENKNYIGGEILILAE